MLNSESIGERIARLRDERELTQKEVAEELNVSSQALSQYELGRRSPGSDSLIRLAEIFGVSLNYLMTGTEELGADGVREGFTVVGYENWPPEAKEELRSMVAWIKHKYRV